MESSKSSCLVKQSFKGLKFSEYELNRFLFDC